MWTGLVQPLWAAWGLFSLSPCERVRGGGIWERTQCRDCTPWSVREVEKLLRRPQPNRLSSWFSLCVRACVLNCCCAQCLTEPSFPGSSLQLVVSDWAVSVGSLVPDLGNQNLANDRIYHWTWLSWGGR